MLHELQNRMVHIAKPVCGIEHSFYRSSSNDDKLEPSKGFIDGDLIKIFLDLPAEVMEQTAEGLQVDNTRVTQQDIIQLINRFSRLL